MPQAGRQAKNTTTMARPLARYSRVDPAPACDSTQRRWTSGVDSSHNRKAAPAGEGEEGGGGGGRGQRWAEVMGDDLTAEPRCKSSNLAWQGNDKRAGRGWV